MLLRLLNGKHTEVLIQKTWKARGYNTDAVFTLMLRDPQKPHERSVNYIAENASQPGILHRLSQKYGDGIWSQIQRQDMLQLATTIKTKETLF